MPVRTEHTLRRMWNESAALFKKAAEGYADADQSAGVAVEHERAAAAEASAAASARQAESSRRIVAKGQEAEAADLADLVNRERGEAGLAPLAPGEPYPPDPSVTETSTDGSLDVSGEVGGSA